MDRPWDAYRVLQLDPGAEPEVVVAVYRALARRYHPDGTHPDTHRMAAINRAYDLLKHPLARRDYEMAGRPALPDLDVDALRTRRVTDLAAMQAAVAADTARETASAAGSAASPGAGPAAAAGSAAGAPAGPSAGSPDPAAPRAADGARPRPEAPRPSRTAAGPLGRRLGQAVPREVQRPHELVLEVGRYKGWTLGALARHDPNYLRWFSEHEGGTRYREAIRRVLAEVAGAA